MNEEWRDIKGFEGYYQISSLGRIKSLKRLIIRRDGKPYPQKECFLKPSKNRKGYLTGQLSKDYKTTFYQVHRLVAEAFIPNVYNLPQVNHIDGNKENNSVDNLEWISNYDNMQHSIKTGLRDVKEISNKMKTAKRREVLQYSIYGEFIKHWKSIKDVETELKIPNQNIVKVCQGKRHTAGGYVWEYYKNKKG